jgi:hypothetical protein
MMKTVKEGQTLTPLRAAKAAAGESAVEKFQDRSNEIQKQIKNKSYRN